MESNQPQVRPIIDLDGQKSSSGPAAGGTGNSSTTNTATGGGRSPGAGNNGSSSPDFKNQGVPKPILINLDSNPSPVSKPAPKPAPKKNKPISKNQEIQELADNIEIFTTAVFSGIAKATDPIWNIRPDEAKSIAKPAARIMDRLGVMESTNAASDYIALILALVVITAPRLIVIRQTRPLKVVKKVEPKRADDTVIRTDNARSVGADGNVGDDGPYFGPVLAQ